jgi:hypothetical protein
VENLAAAVEAGDVKVSIEILKAVGMYGNGTMNAIHEQDPEKLIRQQAEAQVDREGVPKNALLAMAENLETAAYHAPLAEVEARIHGAYLDVRDRHEHPTGGHTRRVRTATRASRLRMRRWSHNLSAG